MPRPRFSRPLIALAWGALIAALVAFAACQAIDVRPDPTQVSEPSVPGVTTITPSVTLVASPAVLAASPVSGLAQGAQVWVQWQGPWFYQSTCTCTIDGVTCVGVAGADGGTGCWRRGNGGYPGACDCASWTIDPVNGSDAAANCGTVQTHAEIARRWADCTVNVLLTISVLSDLLSTDEIATPAIGSAGGVTYDCRPGQVRLYTSGDAGLTDASAHTGNVPIYLSDTAILNWLDAGPEGGTLVGQRFHDLTGARDGGIGWIVAASGTVATVSDVETEELLDGSPNNLPSVTPAVGDLYIVERPPLIPSVRSGGWISSAPYNENGKMEFIGCSFSNAIAGTTCPASGCVYSYPSIPDYGSPHDYNHATNTVRFITSHMGGISGTFTASACEWDDGVLTIQSGQTTSIFGGAIFGDVLIGPGGNALMGQGTVIIGGSNETDVFGTLYISGPAGGLGVLNSPFSAVYAQPGGTIFALSPFWGAGNGTSGGYGVKVRTGGGVYWTSGNTPTITGATGDLIVGGTAKTWAGIAATGFGTNGANAWLYQ